MGGLATHAGAGVGNVENTCNGRILFMHWIKQGSNPQWPQCVPRCGLSLPVLVATSAGSQAFRYWPVAAAFPPCPRGCNAIRLHIHPPRIGPPHYPSWLRCSFVQIYREQVYDLLNPATLADLPLAAAASAAGGRRAAAHGGGTAGARGGRGGLRTGPGGALVLGPLKLRWSKAEEFYLENLFAVGA